VKQRGRDRDRRRERWIDIYIAVSKSSRLTFDIWTRVKLSCCRVSQTCQMAGQLWQAL